MREMRKAGSPLKVETSPKAKASICFVPPANTDAKELKTEVPLSGLSDGPQAAISDK